IAVCLQIAYRRVPDAIFLEAAQALIATLCRRQQMDHPSPGVRGALAGSHPFLGRYMRGRYPSWAAKYLCDGIVALLEPSVPAAVGENEEDSARLQPR